MIHFFFYRIIPLRVQRKVITMNLFIFRVETGTMLEFQLEMTTER